MDSSQTSLGGSISFYVQGSRNTTNNVSIDGVFATDLGSATSTKAVISMGAVGEVKVLVSNYQAEYGRMPGSNIEVVTKSGARDFHGQGEYFMRREFLNANDFINNRKSLRKPLSRFNTITYNIGGPIFIPGLFNKVGTVGTAAKTVLRGPGGATSTPPWPRVSASWSAYSCVCASKRTTRLIILNLPA
jgi:hypothetical protein